MPTGVQSRGSCPTRFSPREVIVVSHTTMVRRQERIGSGRSFHFFTGIGIVIARRRFVFGYKRHGSVAAPLGLGRLPDDAGDALAPGSAVQEWRSPAGGYGRHADRGSKAARIRSIGKRVASDA